MRNLLFLPILLLGACAGKAGTTVQPAPTIIKVPVATYVPIDSEYTARCQWVSDGAIMDIFEVSRGRKRCLEIYEGNFDTIRAIQGKPVPN